MRKPGRPAFVATTGGHLVQLSLLAPLLEPDRHEDALWITHRSPQSESMLAGKRVHWVPMVHARKWHQVLRRTPGVLVAMRRAGVDRVYSTGAALGLVSKDQPEMSRLCDIEDKALFQRTATNRHEHGAGALRAGVLSAARSSSWTLK